MSKSVHLGIIGTGRIGRLHAENLVHRIPEAEVVAVADVRRDTADRCARELGIPHAYGDPAPIFEDPRIEAVLICSSTDTHAQFIEQAAAAKKHIFCEKPIALDLAAIDRALSAVERTGVILQVGFQRRFDPSFTTAQRAVSEEKIGRPHLLRITSRDPEPPPFEYIKLSGGIFLDMTIHDFDMARFLMGEEVVEVYTTGAVLAHMGSGLAFIHQSGLAHMHTYAHIWGQVLHSYISGGIMARPLRIEFPSRLSHHFPGGVPGRTSISTMLIARRSSRRWPRPSSGSIGSGTLTA